MSEEPLEELPTEDLHRRAVALARHNWDVAFFWRLLRALPAAEMAAGNVEASKAGVAQLSGLLSEVLDERSGDPTLIEVLRPYYLEYLRSH